MLQLHGSMNKWSADMHIQVSTVWLQKDGNSADEYEDAFAQVEVEQNGASNFRCVVTDGATEASFSREWARVIAEDYVKEISILETKKRFTEELSAKELNWYAEEKAQLGSFAALIGLEVQEKNTWLAESVGDCVLFHIRDAVIIKSFPIELSILFNNSPELLSSTLEKDPARVRIEGSWIDGDQFFLCSDAIGKWILEHHEARSFKWSEIAALKTQDDLKQFALRHRGGLEGRINLRNDDLTIMQVTVIE